MEPQPKKLKITPPTDLPDLYQYQPPSDPTAGMLSHDGPGITTPIAPPYSPITPRALPTFPATYPSSEPSDDPLTHSHSNTSAQPDPTIAPATFLPEPPSLPFSSEDSTDAIALRAAISSLQFQKLKAGEDLRELQRLRENAVGDAEGFVRELEAGRVGEQKRDGLRRWSEVLGWVGEEPEPGSGERADGEGKASWDDADMMDETHTTPFTRNPALRPDAPLGPFERIPAPQKVVRMPHINWAKYHVNGSALDRQHEQQRRWPGSVDNSQPKGREFTVAAPYSPWYDGAGAEDKGHVRKDSRATAVTPTTTVSEHPMETRRSVKDGL